MSNRLTDPNRPLHRVVASYRTPSGKASHATYYMRDNGYQSFEIRAKIRTCDNYRRKVARGVDGITVEVECFEELD